MIHRVEIATQVTDARSLIRKKQLAALGLSGKIRHVHVVDVLTLAKRLTQIQIAEITALFTNPVVHTADMFHFLTDRQFTWAVEIGFLPGVTDNVAMTAKEMIEGLLKIKFSGSDGIYSSQMILIDGNLLTADIEFLALQLTNPLIQRIHFKPWETYTRDRGMDKVVPIVTLREAASVSSINLYVADHQLTKIGVEGIENPDGSRRGPLALGLMQMHAIRNYFERLKRDPTDVELESLAQTWSEHCKHTIFNSPIDGIKMGLFNRYISEATEKIIKKKKGFCASVFTDNSGAIIFDRKFLITHKIETHNSPSALDPFGGAITGIVGVNRDAIGFGLGAKPIANTYGFCLAPLADTQTLYRDNQLTQKMLPPRRIMDGVIAGVNSGGNCSGIPTPQGFIYFDPRYKGKPLVFVGTIGLIPKKIKNRRSYVKKASPGDYIVMIGGRVGLDGIHGATFSSVALDSGSPATAVQIGDPITQKKLSDALVKEARDLELYTSITDNGAGGLSCSVAEMAKESGGCKVNLDLVPLKYPGLAPWQIWISESQERMTLAVPKRKWPRFQKLLEKRGIEATVIGEFNDSGKCIVSYRDQIVMDIDMKFLHHGLPQKRLTTLAIKHEHFEPKIKLKTDCADALMTMLSRLNLASFEFISQQYDHEVQGTSVLKPLQGRGRVNADTSVVRPVLASNKGIVLSQGLYPSYSDIDTYHMAAGAIDTAVRNVIVAGADPDKIALLDNFCWSSSNRPERLWELKRAVMACYDYALLYDTPFISGKDSMFNDFKGFTRSGKSITISIPPTLLISSVGIIDDITKAVSLDVKLPGDLVYALGVTHDELGGSEYFAMYGAIGNRLPQIDAKTNKKLYAALAKCISQRLISSSLSVTRGGLGVALAKMAMGGLLGLDISLANLPGSWTCNHWGLFSESQGRILVTVAPPNRRRFETLTKGHTFACLGTVTRDSIFKVSGQKGRLIINLKVKNLLKAYKSTFANY